MCNRSHLVRNLLLLLAIAFLWTGCKAEESADKSKEASGEQPGEESAENGEAVDGTKPKEGSEPQDSTRSADPGEAAPKEGTPVADTDPNAAGAGSASEGTETAAAQATPPTSETLIEIVDAGAEPRTELRYTFDPKGTQSVDIIMDMLASVEMGGQKMPEQAMPTTISRIDIQATDVADDGTLRYEYVLSGVSVKSENASPELAKMMESQMKQLEGLEGWARVDSRGKLLDSKMTPPKDAPAALGDQLAQMEQTFQQLAVPLPVEPVGVGAKWQAVTNSRSNGISVKQIAEYHLTSLDGTRGQFSIVISQEAEPQSVDRGGMPPGTEVRLEKLESQGTGSSAFDLTRLVPDAKTELTMTMHMTMKTPDQAAEMKMSSVLEVELKTAK